jgi:hypothetical protein
MKIKKYSSDKNNSSYAKKVLSYATMSGAFLAVADSADAQIIYTDVNPDTVLKATTPSTHSFFPVDFNSDGVVDVVVSHYLYGDSITKQGSLLQFSTSAQTTVVNSYNRVMGDFSGAYFYPSALAAGASISSVNPAFHAFTEIAFQTMTLNHNGSGPWNGTTAFVGVEFKSADSLEVFHGWIELAVDSGVPDSVVVKGYAYESNPGDLIHAGDIGVGIHGAKKIKHSDIVITNNPAGNVPSQVLFTSDKAQAYKIEIINNLGEILRTQSASAVAGQNRVTLDTRRLAAGNYFMKLTLGDTVRFKKLMVAEK